MSIAASGSEAALTKRPSRCSWPTQDRSPRDLGLAQQILFDAPAASLQRNNFSKRRAAWAAEGCARAVGDINDVRRRQMLPVPSQLWASNKCAMEGARKKGPVFASASVAEKMRSAGHGNRQQVGQD